MKSACINEKPERTFVLIFEPGEEVMDGLRTFAAENGITAARLTAIGAFENAVLGYWEIDRKTYRENRFQEQVEVLAFIGDIAMKDGKPVAHVHAVLGRPDAATIGGHLLQAHVRPTLEVVLVQSPAYLRRVMNPAAGLPLIEPHA